MNSERLKEIIDQLEQALIACDDCLVTDSPTAVEDETHWRVDNTEALGLIDSLKTELGESYTRYWRVSQQHLDGSPRDVFAFRFEVLADGTAVFYDVLDRPVAAFAPSGWSTIH